MVSISQKKRRELKVLVRDMDFESVGVTENL